MSQDDNLRWADWLPAGWKRLYLDLLADLTAAGLSVAVAEAKEKFGTLRVYLDDRDALAVSIIAAAEQRSTRTCQTCGDPGELLVRDHHFATLCPVHGKGFTRPVRPPMVSLNIRGVKEE